MQDYYLGGHPAWEIGRCLYQMKYKPYIVNGITLFLGYLWAYLKRVERPVSEEFVAFRRKEQMERMKNIFRKSFG